MLKGLWTHYVVFVADSRERARGRPWHFDRAASRQRRVLECSVGWLKEGLAMATRFGTRAVNHLALVKRARIQRY
jgi:hypothetical protein